MEQHVQPVICAVCHRLRVHVLWWGRHSKKRFMLSGRWLLWIESPNRPRVFRSLLPWKLHQLFWLRLHCSDGEEGVQLQHSIQVLKVVLGCIRRWGSSGNGLEYQAAQHMRGSWTEPQLIRMCQRQERMCQRHQRARLPLQVPGRVPRQSVRQRRMHRFINYSAPSILLRNMK